MLPHQPSSRRPRRRECWPGLSRNLRVPPHSLGDKGRRTRVAVLLASSGVGFGKRPADFHTTAILRDAGGAPHVLEAGNRYGSVVGRVADAEGDGGGPISLPDPEEGTGKLILVVGFNV